MTYCVKWIELQCRDLKQEFLFNKNVVKLAWSILSSMKIKNNQGKWILKQILNKYVPEKYTIV